MAIAVTAETLGTLHRMHRQLEDLREQLAKGPRLIAVRSKQLESAEARHLAVQNEAKKAKLTVDAKQLQLRTAEAKLKDLDSKRNSCKTNREYQLLDGQIAADTMAMKVLEDEILEALERVDTIKQSLPSLDSEIATLKQQLQQTMQQVGAESAALETEVLRVGKIWNRPNRKFRKNPAKATGGSPNQRERMPWPPSMGTAAAGAASRSPTIWWPN